MNVFPFRADKKLTEVLKECKFTFSAEIIPPRNGTEQAKVLGQIQAMIRSGAQFLAVTKGAGGSLRGGSLPIAQAVKEQFNVPCIAHFTCRDLTPHELENHLMDHHYFGIRNILALRGDPPEGQPEWKSKEGSYNYAYQLIEQIRAMNEGRYLQRPGRAAEASQEKTDFCIGAAVYPEHPNEAERSEYFKLKIDAGAEYGITQMLFDPEAYGRFLDLCAKNGIHAPILPGTRLLKFRTQAMKMASRFQVSVPSDILNALPETDAPENLDRALEVFGGFVERLRSLGAPGIHLFVLSDTVGSAAALERLRTHGTGRAASGRVETRAEARAAE